MAVTYEHYMWHGTDAYLNRANGSIIRIKKLVGGEAIADIDIELPTADIDRLSAAELQSMVDRATDADEARDAATIIRQKIVVPAIKSINNTKLKGLTVKPRVGKQVIEVQG